MTEVASALTLKAIFDSFSALSTLVYAAQLRIKLYSSLSRHSFIVSKFPKLKSSDVGKKKSKLELF